MEVDMLFKSKAPEKDKNAAPHAAEAAGKVVQPQHSAAEQVEASPPVPKRDTGSCIGSGMSIVGSIECNGLAQVFGRIEGELRASDLLISSGAQVEGSIIAQDVTVCGRVKGTIRGVRVKLKDGGAVEGDIFHRSLSIDENSQFEGSSRRVENPTEPTGIAAKDPEKKEIQKPAPVPSPSIDGSCARRPALTWPAPSMRDSTEHDWRDELIAAGVLVATDDLDGNGNIIYRMGTFPDGEEGQRLWELFDQHVQIGKSP
jgi:cytoskeletal protein CcmA (bactofilin family)